MKLLHIIGQADRILIGDFYYGLDKDALFNSPERTQERYLLKAQDDPDVFVVLNFHEDMEIIHRGHDSHLIGLVNFSGQEEAKSEIYLFKDTNVLHPEI